MEDIFSPSKDIKPDASALNLEDALVKDDSKYGTELKRAFERLRVSELAAHSVIQSEIGFQTLHRIICEGRAAMDDLTNQHLFASSANHQDNPLRTIGTELLRSHADAIETITHRADEAFRRIAKLLEKGSLSREQFVNLLTCYQKSDHRFDIDCDPTQELYVKLTRDSQISDLESFDSDERWFYAPTHFDALDFFIENTRLTAADTILDLGSGEGLASLYLNHRTPANVIGVEIDPSYLELANYRARKSPLASITDHSRLSFRQADFRGLDLSQASVILWYQPLKEPYGRWFIQEHLVPLAIAGHKFSIWVFDDCTSFFGSTNYFTEEAVFRADRHRPVARIYTTKCSE